MLSSCTLLIAMVSDCRCWSYFRWSASQNCAILVLIVRFAPSTGLSWGVYGGVKQCVILNSCLKFRLSYWTPLSEMSVFGVPKFLKQRLAYGGGGSAESFRLYPLGETVLEHDNVSVAPCRAGQRAYQVGTNGCSRKTIWRRLKEPWVFLLRH